MDENQRQIPPQTNSSPSTTPSALQTTRENPRKRSAESMDSDPIKDLIAKAKQSRTQPPPPPPQQSMDDSIEKELTCSICTDIVFRPVALLDCLHTFCGSCVKQWLERSLRCPSCRTKIKKCKEDHKQNSLLELFLKSHPDRMLSKEEMEERDGIYKPGEKLDVSRDGNRENYDDDDDDDDEYDEVEEEEEYEYDDYHRWEPCPTCNVNPADSNPYEYTCPTPISAGGLTHTLSAFRDHIRCQKCHKSVPMALLSKMRCNICSTIICGSLFDGRCTITDEENLKEARDVQLKIRPFTSYDIYFWGNTVESASFLVWKNENHISDEEIAKRVKDWILQTNNNQLKIRQLNIPLNFKVCRPCVEIIINDNFIDWWIYERERVGLTQSDRRPKCWYGKSCRTQRHSQDHSLNYQHMCEETPPAERRNTAPRTYAQAGGASGGGS